MTQLTYDEICTYVGRQMLENEAKLKAMYQQIQGFKEEFLALKQNSNNGQPQSTKAGE